MFLTISVPRNCSVVISPTTQGPEPTTTNAPISTQPLRPITTIDALSRHPPPPQTTPSAKKHVRIDVTLVIMVNVSAVLAVSTIVSVTLLILKRRSYYRRLREYSTSPTSPIYRPTTTSTPIGSSFMSFPTRTSTPHVHSSTQTTDLEHTLAPPLPATPPNHPAPVELDDLRHLSPASLAGARARLQPVSSRTRSQTRRN